MPDARTARFEARPVKTREVFRARGLRFTTKRARIYEALASTDTHPTAHELLDAVRGVEPNVSLATVYNTLEALTARGLCRRFPGTSGSGSCRYDADVGPHVHVVTEDGRVVDVPSDLSRRLLCELSTETLGELERRLGIRVTEVDVKIVGRTASE